MSFYWIKTNKLIKWLFAAYIWEIPTKSKTVYLTFDDGPTPEHTEWILEELKKYKAKATFFCIGKNVMNNDILFKKILDQQHTIGNHTTDHLNGWQTNNTIYLDNVLECENLIKKDTPGSPKLFRPPYGKIKFKQARLLKKLGYRIIMWDVLSADFDQQITPSTCYNNVIKNVKPGSIIVFHDSIKAAQNLRFALPKTLAKLQAEGYDFRSIS